MDEPLSNLDAKLRVQMRTEISKLHQRLQTTFIYVTHDQTEALTMASRIVVMKDGIIQQVASPTELYAEPCNLFVAGFIGSPQMNTFDATLLKEGEDFYLDFAGTKLKIPQGKAQGKLDAYVGKEVIAGIRPENMHDEESFMANSPESVLAAHVEVTELMGSETYLYLVINGLNFIARVNPRSTAKPNDDIKIGFDMEKLHLFDKETEKTIIN